MERGGRRFLLKWAIINLFLLAQSLDRRKMGGGGGGGGGLGGSSSFLLRGARSAGALLHLRGDDYVTAAKICQFSFFCTNYYIPSIKKDDESAILHSGVGPFSMDSGPKQRHRLSRHHSSAASSSLHNLHGGGGGGDSGNTSRLSLGQWSDHVDKYRDVAL